jgi:photosystem II stability/assembly factor-like uncharacterized protein
LKVFSSVIRSSALTLCLLACASVSTWAGGDRWTCGGPFGGDVNTIVIDPSNPAVLYAGTAYGGVFKSTDSANTWTRKTTGFEGSEINSLVCINAIAIDPQVTSTVYAGTNYGIYKSSDGGETWTRTSTGLDGREVFDICIDPSAPSTLYAIIRNNHGGLREVYKTTDGGGQWTSCNLLDAYRLAIDAMSPSTIFAAVYYGIAKSTDGGASWARYGEDLGLIDIQVVIIDPMTPTSLYATGTDGTGSAQLLKSVDGGLQWKSLSTTEAKANALAIDPLHPDVLYAASSQGQTNPKGAIFKSIDAGAHWATMIGELPASYVACLAIDPVSPSHIYAGTRHGKACGLLKSSDAGATWTESNEGLAAIGISQIAVVPQLPSTLFACNWGSSTFDEGGFFVKSTDYGRSFRSSGGGEGINYAQALAIDPSNASTIYVGTHDSGVLKSLDGGVSWNRLGGGIQDRNILALAIDPSATSTLYAGSAYPGVLKSTDGGTTWTVLPLGDEVSVSSIAVDPMTPSTLYCSFNAAIWKSVDGGVHWSRRSSGITGGVDLLLAISPSVPTTLYAAGERLFKTSDGGASWHPAGSGLQNQFLRAVAVDPVVPGTAYVGTLRGGVFRSIDGGTTWNPMNEGLSLPVIETLAIDPITGRTLYAGTGRGGVFSYTFCQTIVLGPSSLSAASSGVPYQVPMTASGGTAPFTFAVTSGALPQGLNLAPNGTLSGTPAEEGTATFTVTATDALGCSGSASYTLTVVTPPTISLVRKASPPFRLVVTGSNLKPGIKAFINGTEWASVAYKNDGKIQLTGAGLKTAVPKGVPTNLTFTNTDGGTVVVSGWSW